MLGLFSWLYCFAVHRRNAAFDSKKKKAIHVTVPVISVGNLSTGGTGKTPVVQLLVKMLKEEGFQPAVVMRGYRRSSKGLVVVHDGKQICVSVRECGDEAMLHAKELDVPVVVSEYKVDAAVFAAGNLPCDVIVVDDGFQHRQLHRDLDVVLVDKQSVERPWLLPKGRLREPLENVHRADVVLVAADVNIDAIKPLCNDHALVLMHRTVADSTDLPKRVLALSGIANPERFWDTIKAGDAEIVHVASYPDHHWFTSRNIQTILDQATSQGLSVVTTSKDAARLDSLLPMFASANIPLHVLHIHADVGQGAMELRKLVRQRVKDVQQTLQQQTLQQTLEPPSTP